ncbi:MAG: RsmE family RNA methyltransferase, partial [Proteobacteria bacterium]|nr:RsmE family RNA methyltransferase [Pseudomonadota bacterium]
MSNNPRFLSPDIPIIGESLKLGAEESAHCAKVLRMKPGETICLIDGSGTVAEAVITTVLSKGTEVRIIKKDFYHKKSRITLAFGLTKPQALEHIFRKCTELG